MYQAPLTPKFSRLIFIAAAVGALAAGCGGSSPSSPRNSNGGPQAEEPGGGGSSTGGFSGGGLPQGPPGGGGRSGTGGSTGFGSGGSGGAGGSGSVPSPVPPFGGSADAGAAPSGPDAGAGAMGNTNIALGGSQDFGYFRALLNANKVPEPKDFEAAGFFAEHHTPLPTPVCGERVCLQTMLAVMGNLSTGQSCTMLQIGLNSPLVADPNNRPPLSLALSIDVSGSMNQGGKIDFVRAGLEKLIDGMRDTDKVAIITYSDAVTNLFPLAEVGLQRARLREIVRGLQAVGGTNLHDGLKAAFQEVLRNLNSDRQNRVILLSDGQPTVGITGTDAILAMSKSFNSEGVGLTTIGLGTDFNAPLMRGLAQQGDGNFYFLENSAAVSEVFTDELSYFTVPVAFDLKVKMTTGTHYNFGRAYGSPFWKDSATGGGLEVPSVFLAHRKSHADQTPAGGRRGGGSALLIELMPKRDTDDGSGLSSADVSTVEFSFREPGTNRIITKEIIVNYPDAPWRTRETGFFQSADLRIVQKSFVVMNMYIGIEDASRAFHTGDRRPILGNLTRLVAAVVDYNEEIQDKDVEADLVLLRQFMDVLRRNGVVDPNQPMIPRNPWPAD